jgi:hypothetical protein
MYEMPSMHLDLQAVHSVHRHQGMVTILRSPHEAFSESEIAGQSCLWTKTRELSFQRK